MTIPLATAQAQLNLYLAAEAAVLKSQSYEIDGRKLTRANLADIQEGIRLWSERVAAASGRSRARTIVFGGR